MSVRTFFFIFYSVSSLCEDGVHLLAFAASPAPASYGVRWPFPTAGSTRLSALVHLVFLTVFTTQYRVNSFDVNSFVIMLW